MPSDQSNNGKRHAVSLQLRPTTIKRVDELAEAAGVKRASILADLVEELVPKIETVERRVAIKLRKDGQG